MKNRTWRPSAHRRTRRRGTARLFVLSAAVAATALVPRAAFAQSAPPPQAQADADRRLAMLIQPGTLETVMAEFQRLTGVAVTFADPGLGMIQSPGLDGTFAVDDALRRLLMGTGTDFRMTGPAAVTIDVARLSEQVEVTGRVPGIESPKYTVPVRDIPQTIAIVTRDVIEAQGATTLSEALRNVPGITLQAGEGGGASNTAGDMFNLRGFNAANSIFVDGVRDDGLVSRDVYNVEQVEVFMGPTSSDVGRTTAAGYVNMQSKAPHLGSATSVLATFGSAEQARVAADFNWGVAPGPSSGWLAKSAVRLNALWQDSGVAGRNVVGLKTRAFAPSAAFGLDTHTRLTLAGQFMSQDNTPDYGLPGAAWLEEPLAPTTIRASKPVDQSNFYGSPAYDYDNASQNGVTARIEHDLTRTRILRNQTRYNRAHREAVVTSIQNPAAFDPATNLVTLSRQGNDRKNTILSNQTSLLDRFTTGSLQHSTSVGLEFTSEEQFAPTLTGLGTRAPVDIFHPNPADIVAGYAPAHNGASTRGNTNTVALYAFDTIDLSTRWQATGGLRWERYDTDYLAVDATGATTTDLEASDSLVSGKVGVLYRVSPTANLYASIGTAVTPPGTANFTLSAQGNNQNSPNVEPQRSTNYEVGSKWDFANSRLSLNTAIFRTDNENVIYTIDATTIPPLYNQDDKQQVKGVTVGLMGSVTMNWQVFANFGYLDSEQLSQSSVNNGMRLALTPEWSGSLWTTYRTPLRVNVGGGIRFTDEVFVNAANTIKSPGYRLVDALAEYEVNSHLSLRLNVNNLTNSTYVRSVNNNGGRYNPGQPRSAALTTDVRF